MLEIRIEVMIVYSVERPPLHALIIGINKYQSNTINNLGGAVADADAMDQYLRSELHVPTDQIVNLRNSAATREAVLDAFRALRTRKEIRKDDAILIFYAGHGSSGRAPERWDTGSRRISLIVPHDSRMLDAHNQPILDIPDRAPLLFIRTHWT